MTLDNAPICPSCSQLDAVRKASSIYTQGVASQSVALTGGMGTVTGQSTSVTGLSRRLAPPPRPVNKGLPYILTAAILGAMTIFGLLLSSSPLAQKDAPYLFAALGLASIVLLVNGLNLKARYTKEMSGWQPAAAKWNTLFYCSRCDGVFNTQEKEFVPLNQMTNWLYR